MMPEAIPEETAGSGFFEVAREQADLSFATFLERYYKTEQPVIIEGTSGRWPAKHRWTADYLQRALADDPRAKASALWYWLDTGAMSDDYAVPEIINALYGADLALPRTENLRIWVHEAGNVSPVHFDANMINIFNVQVTGSKEWVLFSPRTPLQCYPFSNYAIIRGNEAALLEGRIHTRFVLRTDDMLYIPPCWSHKVTALEQENISLNWVMTNRHTDVSTAGMEREQEIYTLQLLFRRHRYAWVRAAFEKFYFALPSFIRYRWRYPDFIETPHQPGAWMLCKRVLKELAALPSAILNADKAYKVLKNVAPVRPLKRG